MVKTLLHTIRAMDWYLLAGALGLTAFGLVGVGSLALSSSPTDFGNLTKQLLAALLGSGAIMLLSLYDYRGFERSSRFYYLSGAALLTAVIFFGQTIRGTRGWFVAGGFSFQPVEIAKVLLLVYLAATFARHAYARDFWSMLWSGGGVGAYVSLVLLQPDAGSALLMLLLWGFLLLVGGIKRSVLLTVMALAAVIAAASWLFALQPYQKDRIVTFVDPGRDPLGRGYNLTQSVIAVGSGGMFGKGFGEGSQSQLHFLPEAQTDFMFAVLAEQFGAFASLATIGLFALVLYRTWLLARRSRENFTLFLCLGAFLLFAVESVVNIGMNLGLLPVAGLALPFVSYGGSSLVSSLVLIGILESIAVRQRWERYQRT